MAKHASCKITAVVTALNEQDTIGQLTTALFDYCGDVIVINDGSTDNTGIYASASGAHVVNHHEPHGIASSLMEAWQLALDGGAEWIVQIDAGGSHSTEDLWHMMKQSGDIIIGSRFVPGASYKGGWRKHFSRLYAKLCNWAISRHVASDWTSGYRIYSKRSVGVLLKQPAYWTKGHAWQAEILHRAERCGMDIKECPINYTAGRSSMRWGMIDDAILVWLKVIFL